MSAVAPIEAQALGGLVARAAQHLMTATGAAAVLEARDMAGFAYDAAKRAARLAKAKDAHDELISKVHRAQADALEIEAQAKRRLADEYDAAQGRGEVSAGRPKTLPGGNTSATVADIGLTSKQVHEARQIRDAENARPGVIRQILDQRLANGQEPNKAALREGVLEAARQGLRGGGQASSARNPIYEPPSEAAAAWSHVYGTCRAFSEWATAENLRLARVGRFERRDDQSRNIAAVRRALEALSEFERMLDAQ